jgi:hypothetical protein
MKDILLQFLMPLAMALGTLIAAQVVALLRRVLTRVGVQLSADQEAAVSDATKRAVLAVEEWAAKQASTTAAAKYDKAASMLKEKFPKMAAADLDTHIHAAVASLGLGAAAAEQALPPEPPKVAA